MAIKTYYQVSINGKAQRFVGNGRTACAVPAGTGLDGPDEFVSEANARSKADRFGLAGYDVVPVPRDIGTPTNLTEVGF